MQIIISGPEMADGQHHIHLSLVEQIKNTAFWLNTHRHRCDNYSRRNYELSSSRRAQL
jgi:hypothetical protein